MCVIWVVGGEAFLACSEGGLAGALSRDSGSAGYDVHEVFLSRVCIY